MILLCTCLIVSCVNRIDIPEEEDSKLFVSLEMLAGENRIVADVQTSNNLNGTYPISIPNSASVVISEIISGSIDDDNEIELIYDDNTGKYVSENTQTFLGRNRKYELVVKVEDSELQEITAITIVPDKIKVEEVELLSEDEYIDAEGNRYWEGVVGLFFMKASGNKDRYGHIIVEGYETERIITPEGDTTHVKGPEPELFTLEDVEVGAAAVTDMVHREGFLVDYTKLEEEYIELVLRSPFPITKPNHVTNVLFVNIYSVTEAHHDYHVSLHNIKKSQSNIFDEPALYNSNIENGLGLFSSCIYMQNVLELR
jgi:hypothetical protein